MSAATRLTELSNLTREMESAAACHSLQRLASLEQFRQSLLAAFGEEPTVFMSLSLLSPALDDTLEVSLADYFFWFLKARSGALYLTEGSGFRRAAGYGPAPERIDPESPLPQWGLKNGTLFRNRLRLTGLSPAEAESLLSELDRLDADLAVPIQVNDELLGFLVAGQSLGTPYRGGEGLYLNLFGMALLGCLERSRQGLGSRRQMEAAREAQALHETLQIWASLRPEGRPLSLLIQDDEKDSARALRHFFAGWGFEISADAADSDLSLKVLPHHILLESRRLATRQLLPKPCRFARLAGLILEMAIGLSATSALLHA